MSLGLPKLQYYGDANGNHYGTHQMMIEFPTGLAIWYSYETPIAFKEPGRPLVSRKNDWGPTTGKHLGDIPGENRELRTNGDQFECELKLMLRRHNLIDDEHLD